MLWNVQQDIKHSTQCLEEIFTWQQNSGADGAFSADDEKAQWRKPCWFPTTQIHLTGDSKRLFWFPTHKEMQQTNKQIQQTNKQTKTDESFKKIQPCVCLESVWRCPPIILSKSKSHPRIIPLPGSSTGCQDPVSGSHDTSSHEPSVSPLSVVLSRVWPKYICIYGSVCPLKSMYILPPGTWKVARFLSRKMHFNASSICLSSVLCLSVVETCVGQRMCRHFSHFIPSPSRILSSFVYFLLRIFFGHFSSNWFIYVASAQKETLGILQSLSTPWFTNGPKAFV